MEKYLLSILIFLPIIALVLLLFVPAAKAQTIKLISLFATLGLFVCSLVIVLFFNTSIQPSISESFQFVEKYKWINFTTLSGSSFTIDYHVGIDGLSIYLVLLSAFLLVIGVISSWKLQKQVKGYFMLYMVLGSSIMGTFLALDFFLFYLFFELMLLPMFFLIGIWGGPRRGYASVKFFIYTLLGSLLILAAMITLYISAGVPGSPTVNTFNFLYLFDPANLIEGSVLHPDSGYQIFGFPARNVIFLALFFGFAIKLPVVPLHTWLPDAHVEAPTAISVLLAGVLLKVGGYGILRIIFPIFPLEAINYAPMMAFIGVLSILYGGMNALAQRDIKKLVAYSSVAHMGFVLLGMSSIHEVGMAGAVFHMVSHGLISGALFLITGVIYDRTGNRIIENYSGLAQKLPVFTAVVVIVFFASLGLPGLSGFVGELLVLMGAFAAATGTGLIPKFLAFLAVIGILISATFYLWTLQRMFFGKYWIREFNWEAGFTDLDKRERIMLFALVTLIIWLGIWPSTLLNEIKTAADLLILHMGNAGI